MIFYFIISYEFKNYEEHVKIKKNHYQEDSYSVCSYLKNGVIQWITEENEILNMEFENMFEDIHVVMGNFFYINDFFCVSFPIFAK